MKDVTQKEFEAYLKEDPRFIFENVNILGVEFVDTAIHPTFKGCMLSRCIVRTDCFLTTTSKFVMKRWKFIDTTIDTAFFRNVDFVNCTLKNTVCTQVDFDHSTWIGGDFLPSELNRCRFKDFSTYIEDRTKLPFIFNEIYQGSIQTGGYLTYGCEQGTIEWWEKHLEDVCSIWCERGQGYYYHKEIIKSLLTLAKVRAKNEAKN